MNVLIIGSGSYVLGDMYGPGVILRSVVQWLMDEAPAGETAHSVTVTVNNSSTMSVKQDEIQQILADLAVPELLVRVSLVHTQVGNQILSEGGVSACFVSVPDRFHADYAARAIRAGVPLWIVKPLTGELKQAQHLLALSRENKAKVWVDYHKRFDVSNRLLKRQNEQQGMGRMLAYSVDYHQPRTLPLDVFDWVADVDVFTYIGCHYVDQLFFLFPEAELQYVSARPLKGAVFDKTGQYDGVLALLSFQTNSGALECPMNVGWFNPLGSPTKSLQTLKVQFEKGLVELDQTRRGVQSWTDDGVLETNPYFFCQTTDVSGRVRYEGYGYDSVRYFLDAVQDGGSWPDDTGLPTLNEAVKTEYVLSVVQQALKAGNQIVIKEN